MNQNKKKETFPASLIFGLVAALLLIIFAIQNSQTADVHFFFWPIQLPMAVILFATFILGAFTALMWSIPAFGRKRKRIKELEKELSQKEKKMKTEKASADK